METLTAPPTTLTFRPILGFIDPDERHRVGRQVEIVWTFPPLPSQLTANTFRVEDVETGERWVAFSDELYVNGARGSKR